MIFFRPLRTLLSSIIMGNGLTSLLRLTPSQQPSHMLSRVADFHSIHYRGLRTQYSLRITVVLAAADTFMNVLILCTHSRVERYWILPDKQTAAPSFSLIAISLSPLPSAHSLTLSPLSGLARPRCNQSVWHGLSGAGEWNGGCGCGS